MLSFLTSSSFAIIFIVCFFIFITRSSWVRQVEKLRFNIKKNGFEAKDGSQEQASQSTIDSSDREKLNKKLSNMGIDSESSFDQFLQNIDIEFKKKDSETIQNTQTLSAIYELYENYKFGFLNYYLVPASKFAVLWFHKQASTKRNFDLNFPLLNTPPNIEGEKEAIFNALISHGLIFKNQDNQYATTPHGKKFLKFILLVN